MKTYWISFADDTGNLGCCIVDAFDERDAIEQTFERKLNPGGEAMLVDITGIDGAEEESSKWGKNRLITASELLNDGCKKLSDLPDRIALEIGADSRVSRVCETHNHL